MASSAKALAEQVKMLEGKLAEAKAAIPSFEKALAEAYTSGDDARVKKAHSALVDSRDALPSILAALRQSDKLFYAQAFAEYEKAALDLSRKTEATYEKFMDVLRSSAKEFRRILENFFPEAGRVVDEELLTPFSRRVWEMFDSRAGETTQEPDFPRPPNPVPIRDANGLRPGQSGYHLD